MADSANELMTDPMRLGSILPFWSVKRDPSPGMLQFINIELEMKDYNLSGITTQHNKYIMLEFYPLD
jgi:hypothetical protein